MLGAYHGRMCEDSSMPRSIGAASSEPAPGTTSLTDPALVRLYEALKGLDRALHDALRALDVALGRDPTVGPPAALPLRELSRLKHQLEQASGGGARGRRMSLGDIALVRTDDDDSSPDDTAPRAGVAPRSD